jgi:hypothetical protein
MGIVRMGIVRMGIVRMEIVNVDPSGIGPMRVADAQTGRPYSNHFRGWKVIIFVDGR